MIRQAGELGWVLSHSGMSGAQQRAVWWWWHRHELAGGQRVPVECSRQTLAAELGLSEGGALRTINSLAEARVLVRVEGGVGTRPNAWRLSTAWEGWRVAWPIVGGLERVRERHRATFGSTAGEAAVVAHWSARQASLVARSGARLDGSSREQKRATSTNSGELAVNKSARLEPSLSMSDCSSFGRTSPDTSAGTEGDPLDGAETAAAGFGQPPAAPAGWLDRVWRRVAEEGLEARSADGRKYGTYLVGWRHRAVLDELARLVVLDDLAQRRAIDAVVRAVIGAHDSTDAVVAAVRASVRSSIVGAEASRSSGAPPSRDFEWVELDDGTFEKRPVGGAPPNDTDSAEFLDSSASGHENGESVLDLTPDDPAAAERFAGFRSVLARAQHFKGE